MFEYKYIRIEVRTGLWRLKPTRCHREIIDEQAAAGWRFVQVFAPAISGYGAAAYYELIFERPKT